MADRVSSLWQLISEIIAEPTANLTSALLLFAVIVLLLLIMVVIAAFFLVPVDDGDKKAKKRAGRRAAELPTTAVTAATVQVAAVCAEPDEGPAPQDATTSPGRTRLIAWGLPVTVALLVLAAMVSAYWITSTDIYCVSCHAGYAMAGSNEGTATAVAPDASAHESVHCVACHESRLPLGLSGSVVSRARHLAAQALDQQPSAVPIDSGACMACHSGVLDAVITAAEEGVRVSHAEPVAAGMACTACHSDLGHNEPTGSGPGMSACVRCHDGERASSECAVCHIGDVAEASAEELIFAPVNLSPVTECGGCHDQASCDECHGIRMPHPQAFLDGEHARVAGFDKKRECWSCHVLGDCGKCHQTKPESVGYWGHGDGPIWKYQHGRLTPPGTQAGCGCHGRSPYARAGNYCAACH